MSLQELIPLCPPKCPCEYTVLYYHCCINHLYIILNWTAKKPFKVFNNEYTYNITYNICEIVNGV